jgi:hypothetical protein
MVSPQMADGEYEIIDWTKKKRRLTKVTNIEKDAHLTSDSLSKAIKYLYKTDVTPDTCQGLVRKMIEDNLIEFYKRNTKEMQENKV